MRAISGRKRAFGAGFSLWESESDLIASETSGYLQEMRAITAPFYVMPPFREVYEVSLQTFVEPEAPEP